MLRENGAFYGRSDEHISSQKGSRPKCVSNSGGNTTPEVAPSTRLSTASPGEVKGAAFFGETPHETERLAKAYVGLSEPFN